MPAGGGPFAQQADLEIAAGGAKRLLQLADFNQTNDINSPDVQTVIQGWLMDGAAELRTAAEVKHDPETLANLDPQSLRRMVDANAMLSARAAFQKGTGGVAMPDGIDKRSAAADSFCDQLASGTRRLGRSAGGAPAAINQPVGTVDFDPDGSAVSILGFRRGGFR